VGYFGPGSGTLTTSDSELRLAQLLTSCVAEGPNGRDKDTGFFIIYGGTGRYAGALGGGTVDGDSDHGEAGTETHTFSGVIDVRESATGELPALPATSAGGSFRASAAGTAVLKGKELEFKGRGKASLSGRFAVRGREVIDGVSQSATGCRALSGGMSFHTSRNGNLGYSAIGLACGSGKTLRVAGYFLVDSGTLCFASAFGRGAISATVPAGKTGRFNLALTGAVVLHR
jgi:hypothetical protein